MFRFNPQWEGRPIFEHPEEIRSRDVLGAVEEVMNVRQMVVVTGPRRSGKTTVLRQVQDGLLKKSVDPKRTLYFSFDEVTDRDPYIIEDIVTTYLTRIHPGRPSRENRAFVFLDEVQFVHQWPSMLMRLYESEPHLKIFASGSSTLKVWKGSGESLAGRRFDVTVKPLSFREYLAFKDIDLPRIDYDVAWDGLSARVRSRADEIEGFLDQYLLRGGFPETVAMGSLQLAQRYLHQSVIEKAVYFDIPEVESVRNPLAMMNLLTVFASMTSRQFEIGNLSSSLGLTRQTISSYISILERSQLVGLSYNFTKSKVRQARTSKRIYMRDTGVACSLVGYDESVGASDMGRLAETAVFNHLCGDAPTYFWRDPRGNEVDFVIRRKRDLVPVEVKYQSSVTRSDAKGLSLFCRQNRHASPLLLSRGSEGVMDMDGLVVQMVPLWRYLLSF
jgi:predicted AAA+ superfamily ATPase